MKERSDYQIAAANERIVRRLRERDVYCSVNHMVDDVTKLFWAAQETTRRGPRKWSVDEEQISDVGVRRGTPAIAIDNSMVYEIGKLADGEFYWYDRKKTTPYVGTAPDHSVVVLKDGRWQALDGDGDEIDTFSTEKEAMNATWTGWLQDQDQGFFDTADEACEACCEENGIHPDSYDAENIFHYAVSNFLAEQLKAVDEQVVEDFMGLNVWCLTGENTTSALMRVAHNMGILVGQPYSWDEDERAYQNRHRYRIGELTWWAAPDDPQLAGLYRITEEVQGDDTLGVTSTWSHPVQRRARYEELTRLPQPPETTPEGP